jgi:hypothetical protein
MVGNIQEAKARGGAVIAIASEGPARRYCARANISIQVSWRVRGARYLAIIFVSGSITAWAQIS